MGFLELNTRLGTLSSTTRMELFFTDYGKELLVRQDGIGLEDHIVRFGLADGDFDYRQLTGTCKNEFGTSALTPTCFYDMTDVRGSRDNGTVFEGSYVSDLKSKILYSDINSQPTINVNYGVSKEQSFDIDFDINLEVFDYISKQPINNITGENIESKINYIGGGGDPLSSWPIPIYTLPCGGEQVIVGQCLTSVGPGWTEPAFAENAWEIWENLGSPNPGQIIGLTPGPQGIIDNSTPIPVLDGTLPTCITYQGVQYANGPLMNQTAYNISNVTPGYSYQYYENCEDCINPDILGNQNSQCEDFANYVSTTYGIETFEFCAKCESGSYTDAECQCCNYSGNSKGTQVGLDFNVLFESKSKISGELIKPEEATFYWYVQNLSNPFSSMKVIKPYEIKTYSINGENNYKFNLNTTRQLKNNHYWVGFNETYSITMGVKVPGITPKILTKKFQVIGDPNYGWVLNKY